MKEIKLTAAELLVLLSNNGSLNNDGVYRAEEKLVLESNICYCGNGATIIADGGIEVGGDNASLYGLKIISENGIVSTYDDFTVQNCEIISKNSGIISSGKRFIARNNKISSEDGIAIKLRNGSYNCLTAQNVLAGSIIVNGAFNCAVILNTANSVMADNSTNVYIIENKIKGLEVNNNRYIICDENEISNVVSNGNSEMNGSNIQDLSLRSEYGVNESLLPHLNRERFVGMERRETVTDISNDESINLGKYICTMAENNSVVIVPPGAYVMHEGFTVGDLCSNTDIYCYGVYAEADYTGQITRFDHCESINFKGLTWGYTRAPSGQLHIVKKLGDRMVLAVNAAGYPYGFGRTDSAAYWAGRLEWHQNAPSPFRSTNDYAISDNGDGTFTVTIDNDEEYDSIELGDVWTCRLRVARIQTVMIEGARGLHFKDITCHGYANATHWRNHNCENVTYERAHATPNAPFIIEKELYDKYKALGEKYGVDLEVHIDEKGRYRGGRQRNGGTGTMEVAFAKGGINLTSCILENMFDDGSNQRSNSSRLAGFRDNNDGTCTVYFKDCISSVYYKTIHSPYMDKDDFTAGGCAAVEKGDKLFAYGSNGAVLFDGAEALENAVLLKGSKEHLAHEDDGDGYCKICHAKICNEAFEYPTVNSSYDSDGGQIHFSIRRYNRAGTVNYTANIYSVRVRSENVNVKALEGYDLLSNDWYPETQFFLDNMTKNCPKFTFDNVLLQNGVARGVLIKTEGVTIKHCTFKNIGLPGLKIGKETDWGESSVPRNVLITNCIFDNTGMGIHPGLSNAVGHGQINIQGLGGVGGIYNGFPLRDDFACSNIMIRHNKFLNTQNKYIINASGARDITIMENVLEERVNDGKVMHINNCVNVTLSGNKYSDNIKPFVEKKQLDRFIDGEKYKGLNIEGTQISL